LRHHGCGLIQPSRLGPGCGATAAEPGWPSEAIERRCTKPATLQAEQRRACNFSNPRGIEVIDTMRRYRQDIVLAWRTFYASRRALHWGWLLLELLSAPAALLLKISGPEHLARRLHAVCNDLYSRALRKVAHALQGGRAAREAETYRRSLASSTCSGVTFNWIRYLPRLHGSGPAPQSLSSLHVCKHESPRPQLGNNEAAQGRTLTQ
jgi:hypothetical protein